MKEFLINILNVLGLGVNGVMTNNRQLFADRLMGYVPSFNITCSEKGDCVTFVCKSRTDGSSFTIEYKLKNKRIAGLSIID